MIFEIRHLLTGLILFSLDTKSLKICVEAAVQSGSDLSGSDLSGSDLSCSNLSGSNLRCSDLSGSDLSGSDLSYSNLSGSDLSGSDLSGSNLRCSDLSGSDLSGSKLIGKRPILNIGPIGSRSDYLIAYFTDKGILIRTGCFFGTLQEFKKRVEDEHRLNCYGLEYLAAISLIEEHSKIWDGKEEVRR